MPTARCFQNAIAQTIHRYADIVLLLLIAGLSWWLVQVDSRIVKTTDIVLEVRTEQATRKTRVEEIPALRSDVVALRAQVVGLGTLQATLDRHEGILRRLEERLNMLLERRMLP